MNDIHNKRLSPNARSLRKKMTKEERHLWYDFLKLLPYTVHRQKVIGKYIVDFYIACAKIIIEIDGTQHYEDKGRQNDQIRDAYFKKQGFTILRYSNRDINTRFREVCEDILNHQKSLPLEGKGDRRTAVDEV